MKEQTEVEVPQRYEDLPKGIRELPTVRAALATIILWPFVFLFGVEMAILAIAIALIKGSLREPKPANRPGRVVEREFYQQHQAA